MFQRTFEESENDGLFYRGGKINGTYDGYGVLRSFSNQEEIIEGEFSDGSPNGECQYKNLTHGFSYNGEYRNGKRHGYGEFSAYLNNLGINNTVIGRFNNDRLSAGRVLQLFRNPEGEVISLENNVNILGFPNLHTPFEWRYTNGKVSVRGEEQDYMIWYDVFGLPVAVVQTSLIGFIMQFYFLVILSILFSYVLEILPSVVINILLVFFAIRGAIILYSFWKYQVTMMRFFYRRSFFRKKTVKIGCEIMLYLTFVFVATLDESWQLVLYHCALFVFVVAVIVAYLTIVPNYVLAKLHEKRWLKKNNRED